MKVDTSATATASLFARLSLSSTSSSQQTTTMTTTTTTPQQELSSRRSSSSSSSSNKLFSMDKPLYGIPAKNTQQQLLCTISNAIATFPDEEKEEMELVVQKSELSSSSSHGPQQERQHPSVMLPSSNDYAINPKAWSKLSPVVWDRISSRDYGEEIRMEWKQNNYSNDDDTDLLAVAKMVVDEMNTNEWFVDYDNDDERNSTDLSNTINKFYPSFRLLNIESSMKSFVSICRSNLNNIMGYRIKVSIMHGKSATRCPSWHTDYVPIRWIQSMVGPGSDFINDDGNNDKDDDDDDVISYLQRVRNNDKEYEVQEENDRPDWKDILIERSHVQIQQVPTGQPLVIVGNAWSEWSKEEDTSPSIGRRRYGILHRSPQNVPKDQGRILLVLDVIHGRDDNNNNNNNSNNNSNNYNNKNKNMENNSPCEKDCCSSQKTLN